MKKAVGMLLLACAISGCAQQLAFVQKGPEYPAHTNPNAPLVLAIPGLNVPGAGITQEQHFGNLVAMLAEQGIPAKVLAYDTPENPLTPVASLAFNPTDIGTTRVGPAVVNEIQSEKDRRATLGLPVLKEVVFFSYSQGAVIAHRVALGIFLFKKKYEEFCLNFGQEWAALQRDPEFLLLMDSLQDYLVIRDIKVQRERDFQKDPDLKAFYARAQKKLDKRAEELLRYLEDPSEEYPGVHDFDPPETDKYPKRYVKLRTCAADCFKFRGNLSEIQQFFVDYATYKGVLDVDFRFLSTAGSYFGSPRANEVVGLMQTLPFLQPFVGSELRQIKDTQLGAAHQTEDAEKLLELKRQDTYPLQFPDSLFVVGANGDQGDGLVDQSAGHLANHALGSARIKKGSGEDERIEVVVDRLPDLAVIPLPLKHFPENNFFAGRLYGAAYMEKGNPVFPYLLAFLDKDWKQIMDLLDENAIRLRQFMVEISFDKDMAGLDLKGSSNNVRVNHRFINPEGKTVVWTGTFAGKDQCMNLEGCEDDSGFFTLAVSPRGSSARYLLDVPVYPGCNTLLKLEGV